MGEEDGGAPDADAPDVDGDRSDPVDPDDLDPDVRAEIARAVGAALAEHGYARLRTKHVAAASELSEAGLYYHCDSKEAMVAVFLEAAQRQREADYAAIEDEDPEARLRAACDALMVDADDERARGINVAVMELLAHAPHEATLREPLRALQETSLSFLAATIEDGIERGAFRDVDPRGTAGFLKSAADGWTGFSLALGIEGMDAKLRDQMDAFIDSLLVDAET